MRALALALATTLAALAGGCSNGLDVKGVVTDCATGAPLAGATVHYVASGRSIGISTEGTLMTAPDGSFLAGSREDSNVSFHAEKPGYLPADHEKVVYYWPAKVTLCLKPVP
jgi:carboxypeptidase family protein